MQCDAQAHADELLQRFYATDGPEADAVAGALVACVQPRVRAFLAGKGARREDLDDLCQEVGVRLLHALRRSRAPDGERIKNGVSLATTIARNLLTDGIRHERARPRPESIEALMGRSNRNPDGILPPSPDDVSATVLCALSAEHLRAQLWQVIHQLPPLQRAALLLGMEQDELLLLQIKQTEVAKALGIPLPELFAVWRGLPLPDREIARRLGVANVSNLRKCARERIARHLSVQKLREEKK